MKPHPNLVEVCAAGARKIMLGDYWPDVPRDQQEPWREAAQAILTGDEAGLSDAATKVLQDDYSSFVTHADGGDVLRHAVHAIEAGWYTALSAPKQIG